MLSKLKLYRTNRVTAYVLLTSIIGTLVHYEYYQMAVPLALFIVLEALVVLQCFLLAVCTEEDLGNGQR